MIEPLQSDDVLLADIERARLLPHQLHLWWLGQSGYLMQWQGRHALIDPYLSESLTVKYALTDKPHIRMSRRVIDPARLSFVDVVSSSHAHTDHLDAETLKAVGVGARPPIVIPEANRDLVATRLGIDRALPIGMDDGTTAQIGPFEFTAIASAHETVERDERGRCRFLGYVIRAGGLAVYHSGDTILHDGLAPALAKFDIDVALLPINGRLPERRVSGNLWGPEAAWLAREIGAKLVIPCHYDLFEFNTVTPDAFVAECRRLNQPYQVLQLGQRWSIGG